MTTRDSYMCHIPDSYTSHNTRQLPVTPFETRVSYTSHNTRQLHLSQHGTVTPLTTRGPGAVTPLTTRESYTCHNT